MSAIQQLDQFNLHHVLEETPGTSLLFFSGPACGACKQLKQLFADSAELFGALHIFEVDAERDMALTREFDVFHLPAMFLYHNGRYHCRLEAQARPQQLYRAIAQALQHPAEEAP